MRVRIGFGLIALALGLPAVVWAEKLPPHSSFYNESANYRGKGTDIEFLVRRASNKADIYAYDPCLGTGQGGYTPGATARGVAVHKGKISYDGNATVYSATGSTTVKLKVSATVKAKKVSGSVSFPNSSGCTSRSFVAKLTSHTK